MRAGPARGRRRAPCARSRASSTSARRPRPRGRATGASSRPPRRTRRRAGAWRRPRCPPRRSWPPRRDPRPAAGRAPPGGASTRPPGRARRASSTISAPWRRAAPSPPRSRSSVAASRRRASPHRGAGQAGAGRAGRGGGGAAPEGLEARLAHAPALQAQEHPHQVAARGAAGLADRVGTLHRAGPHRVREMAHRLGGVGRHGARLPRARTAPRGSPGPRRGGPGGGSDPQEVERFAAAVSAASAIDWRRISASTSPVHMLVRMRSRPITATDGVPVAPSRSARSPKRSLPTS